MRPTSFSVERDAGTHAMSKLRRQSAESGQTLVLLALLLGILMIVAALVIDIGSHHRVRTETHYVCDAGALAGVAELLQNHSPTSARARALDVCKKNGYEVGKNSVTSIEAVAFNHRAWPDEDPTQIDVADSDRYRVTISRELPYFIANVIGFRRSGVTQYAVAAIMSTVPMPAGLGTTVGFPDKANLSQFGPDAPYTFGDCYSTKKLDDGSPNLRYDPNGYSYDLVIPSDLESSSGSSLVRVEIFDPDTINKGGHVAQQPSRLSSSTGNAYEPDTGGLDEIRNPPPDGNGYVSAATFPSRSTQTEFIIKDKNGVAFATASYGPTSVTPFWGHLQDPGPEGSTAPAVTANADPAQTQIATDLRWVTPQGFQFDTKNHAGPYTLAVRTVSGASENGYQLRISARRPNGVPFTAATYGVTPTSALSVFAHGRVPINFSAPDVTKIPIASVPKGTTQLTITNYDTDVGSQYSKYTLEGFDATTGQGSYPVLWEYTPPQIPPSSSDTHAPVQADNGKWYATQQPGTLSTNGTFATDTLPIPTTVIIPQTDGSGGLVYDSQGRIKVVATRPFEGADLQITYSAGAYDTSVWEVSQVSTGNPGNQTIVLIR